MTGERRSLGVSHAAAEFDAAAIQSQRRRFEAIHPPRVKPEPTPPVVKPKPKPKAVAPKAPLTPVISSAGAVPASSSRGERSKPPVPSKPIAIPRRRTDRPAPDAPAVLTNGDLAILRRIANRKRS